MRIKCAIAIAVLAALFLVLISFVDSDIKLKEVFLIYFGMLLGIITQYLTKYIDIENEKEISD